MEREKGLRDKIERLEKEYQINRNHKLAFKIGILYHKLYDLEEDPIKKKRYCEEAYLYYRVGVVKRYIPSAVKMGELMIEKEPRSDEAKFLGGLSNSIFGRGNAIKAIEYYLKKQGMVVGRAIKQARANERQKRIYSKIKPS